MASAIQGAEGVSYTQPASQTSSGKTSISNIDIDVADNGFVVTCRRKQPESKTNRPTPYVEPSKHAFTSKSELMAWIDKELPGRDEDEEPETEQGGTGKAGAAPPAGDEDDGY